MKVWVPGELPLVAGARELKEPGGREGIGRIGMGLDEGEPVSRVNASESR